MFYTIYKITNKLDDKIYIGKHQTKNLDDGYMGSGKRLFYAISKYGIDNFEKEILFIYDNEYDMNAKEAELVTEEFVKEDTNYNICAGGKGGFGYINENILTTNARKTNGKIGGLKGGATHSEKIKTDDKYRNDFDARLKLMNEKAIEARRNKYPNGTFSGKSHSEEWKQNHSSIMKQRSKGANNSNYGKKYIYSLIEKRSKTIPKDDPVPEGWKLGRKIKFDTNIS